jgi:FixJ family two-component response regulator
LKTGRKKKTRITRHARIKRSSSAKRRISELRSHWDILDPVTRGERLRELIALGCTGRGLADDLRVSPTNIRFHRDLAEITPTEKLALKAGGSAKQAFEMLQRRREAQARMDRVRR